jgi:hypothetical protein
MKKGLKRTISWKFMQKRSRKQPAKDCSINEGATQKQASIGPKSFPGG